MAQQQGLIGACPISNDPVVVSNGFINDRATICDWIGNSTLMGSTDCLSSAFIPSTKKTIQIDQSEEDQSKQLSGQQSAGIGQQHEQMYDQQSAGIGQQHQHMYDQQSAGIGQQHQQMYDQQSAGIGQQHQQMYDQQSAGIGQQHQQIYGQQHEHDNLIILQRHEDDNVPKKAPRKAKKKKDPNAPKGKRSGGIFTVSQLFLQCICTGQRSYISR